MSPQSKNKIVFEISLLHPKKNEQQLAKINRKMRKYFSFIPTKKSLFFFSKTSRFRQLCFLITTHKIFRVVQTIIIVLLCANLSFETFVDEPEYQHLKEISIIINVILNIVFFVESLLSVVTMGLIMKKRSYLRNIFNLMDAIASLGFFLDTITNDEDFPTFRVRKKKCFLFSSEKYKIKKKYTII